ncbi:hypothetical protein NDA18_000949 [Ustilago nuda]|nr:hypothetical protein NDA18_000949 [Ustilago nuda]
MSSTSSPSTPTKHKRRSTHLLANLPQAEPADVQRNDLFSGIASSSRAFDTERGVKPQMVVAGGEIASPVSDMRSTVRKAEMMDEDMDADEMQPDTPRKVSKIGGEMKNVKPDTAALVQPTTPKKGRSSKAIALSSKDVLKTPTKKEPGSGPNTPRTPEHAPLASTWSPDRWNDLNFAILKVVHDHASEIYDASPSLLPWKVKGRLLVKLRQLLKEASGGDVASKRWDTELKPLRTKGGSPKRQPQQ